MKTGKMRYRRWFALALVVSLTTGLRAYAQDDANTEKKIEEKTESTIVITKDVVESEETRRIVLDAERSGIESMMETIVDSVGEWVDASADALERSIESFSGPRRERMAKSESGKTRDIHLTKRGFTDGEIKIHNIAGKVVVIGWDQNDIAIEGHLGQDVEELEFDVSSRRAEIRVKVPKGRSRKIRSELTIHVPMQNTVDISTVSATIEVEGLDGDKHAMESVSGSIRVGATSGAMDISSVSGQISIDDADNDVEIENVSGAVQVKGDYPNARVDTVSGAIRLDGARKTIRAETVSGSIRLHGDTLEELRVEAVSGSIVYTGGLSDRAEVRADSLSGSIRLELDRPLEGEYDLKTFSGSIRCDLGLSTITRNKGRGKHIVFNNGDGKARIQAETFSGSLTISTQ
jgi:DUF4097 and DUF4098 domain-containing protein YvlB